MIELAFLVCLGGQPSVCERRAIQFADMPLMTCMIGAQAQLAQWQSEHPDWTIQRWSCQAVRPGRRT